MTERERLIELIGQYTENITARELHKAEFEEKFTDYLLDNGVIVPPVKVGDMVYVINRQGKPQEMKFDSVDLRCICTREGYCGLCTRCMDREGNMCQYRFKNDFSDFGKTVFLSREEAEKALKARGK